MALELNQKCAWCERREPVEITRGMNLADLPLPEGWATQEAFPGGNVGPKSGQDLCDTCAADYPAVLSQADTARDAVYRAAMERAKTRASTVGSMGKKLQSSSFAAR